MPSRKKLDLSHGAVVLICSRTYDSVPTGRVGFSTDAQINCMPHTCLDADRKRLHTHTQLRELKEVKSSAVIGLLKAALASDSLSATTEIICIISVVSSLRISEAS